MEKTPISANRTTPSDRTELVIVSPHRDDAAFSSGVLLHAALSVCSVRILNIFTRSGYAPFAPEVEANGIEAVSSLRAAEDQALLQLLRAAARHGNSLSLTDLDLLDAPWRLHLPIADVLDDSHDAEAYAAQVSSLVPLLTPHLQNAQCVLLPLALGGSGLQGHIDHRITRDAGLQSAPAGHLAFYEDLPYAANMHPSQRDAAISSFAATHSLKTVQLQYPESGTLKLRCAQSYPSQVAPTTMWQMSVYSQQHGGEQLYAAASAQNFLKHLQDSSEPS